MRLSLMAEIPIDTEAAREGAARLASGEYGPLGIVLVIVLTLFVVFGAFYIVWTTRELSRKSAAIKELADAKDKVIAVKDAKIQELFEKRVQSAEDATEAILKSQQSIEALQQILQIITGQLQTLIGRGGT